MVASIKKATRHNTFTVVGEAVSSPRDPVWGRELATALSIVKSKAQTEDLEREMKAGLIKGY